VKPWWIVGVSFGVSALGCASAGPGWLPEQSAAPEAHRVVVFVHADVVQDSVVKQSEPPPLLEVPSPVETPPEPEPAYVSTRPGGGDPLNGELWTAEELAEAAAQQAARAKGKGDEATIAPKAAKPPAAPPVFAHESDVDSPGRLPAGTIRHIVHMNMGRFRGCYADGLTRNPKLKGRVTTRFVIHDDGQVSEATNVASTLPDAAVAQCIAAAFRQLSFPRQPGGVITVTYPLELTPRSEG
jgi:hypothetical protein